MEKVSSGSPVCLVSGRVGCLQGQDAEQGFRGGGCLCTLGGYCGDKGNGLDGGTHPSSVPLSFPPAAPAGLGLTPLSGYPGMTSSSSPSAQYPVVAPPVPARVHSGWHEDGVSLPPPPPPPPTPPLPSSPWGTSAQIAGNKCAIISPSEAIGLMSWLCLTARTHTHARWIAVMPFSLVNECLVSCLSCAAEKVASLGKDWHKLCLKCDRCNKLLNAGGHAEVSSSAPPPPTPPTPSNSLKLKKKYPLDIKEPIESVWKEEGARFGRNFSL